MFSFVLSRLSYGLLVIVLVTIIVSGIVLLTPVDPARLTFGQQMDEESLALKREQLGLNESIPRQILLYIRDISPSWICFDGDCRERYTDTAVLSLGTSSWHLKKPFLRVSYQSGQSVPELLSKSIFNTLCLAISAMMLAILIGVSLGTFSALRKGSLTDNMVVILSTLGYSVPSYITAILLGVLFGYYLRAYTGINIQGSLLELNDLGDEVIVVKNLILPTIALGIRPISIITQLTRSAVLQVMSEKHVLVAKAKGMSTRRLIVRHVLRNSLNPVVTALSGWFAALLAGAFFVEYVFNYKGLGYTIVTALMNYDIPVLLGGLLFTCVSFVIINIAVDLSYRWLDPRIR